MYRKDVFDLLATITGRQSLSDLQKRELRTNIVDDFRDFIYVRAKWTLRIIRWLRFRVDSCMFDFLIYPKIKFYSKYVITLPHYKPLLDILYGEINDFLGRNGIVMDLDGVEDICRWSVVNAEYVSTFGFDKRISVNSGTIYFLHVFCRCLQPFLMDKDFDRHHPLIGGVMKRQFKKSVIAYCTNNHRKVIRFLSMVPEDGSLLDGMEKFVLGHELGHAYFNQYGKEKWPFSTPLDSELLSMKKNDEECGADLFAINMIWLMRQDNQGEYLLYGACLFFLLLNWFEEANLVKKPVTHPRSCKRYSYLLQAIRCFSEDEYNKCIEWSTIMNNLWENAIMDVTAKIGKAVKDRMKYEPELLLIREYAVHYFRCHDLGEE